MERVSAFYDEIDAKLTIAFSADGTLNGVYKDRFGHLKTCRRKLSSRVLNPCRFVYKAHRFPNKLGSFEVLMDNYSKYQTI